MLKVWQDWDICSQFPLQTTSNANCNLYSLQMLSEMLMSLVEWEFVVHKNTCLCCVPLCNLTVRSLICVYLSAHLPISTCLFTCVCLCSPVSFHLFVFTCLCLPGFTYLCLPVRGCLCVHLCLPMCTCLYLCSPVCAHLSVFLSVFTHLHSAVCVPVYDHLHVLCCVVHSPCWGAEVVATSTHSTA